MSKSKKGVEPDPMANENDLSTEKQNEPFYGEPWGSYGVKVTRDNKKLFRSWMKTDEFPQKESVATFDDERDARRAEACVNALQGCSDPLAFVEEAIELVAEPPVGKRGKKTWIRPEPESALYWLKAKS